jgi:hypothetical protein
MSDYIDLAHKQVWEDSGDHRIYIGKFFDAVDLQACLQIIKPFKGYKKPKKYSSVIRRFIKETGREVFY